MIRDCDVIPDRGMIEEERRESGYYDEPMPVEQARRIDDFLVALLKEIQPGVEALERRRAKASAEFEDVPLVAADDMEVVRRE